MAVDTEVLAARCREEGEGRNGDILCFLAVSRTNDGVRMQRAARASVVDYCYQVIDHVSGRAEVFHAEGDDQAFINFLGQ